MALAVLIKAAWYCAVYYLSIKVVTFLAPSDPGEIE